MGEVIVVTSGKGGVGKTTVTANLGAELAKAGKKTVIVDMDLGLRSLDVIVGHENFIIYNLIDVISKKCTLNQVLIKDETYENLFLLPSSQTKDPSCVSLDQVKELCETLKHEFDYVILDSPSGIGKGFQNATTAADKAILVVTPDIPSVRDADCVSAILARGGLRDQLLILNRNRADLANEGKIMSLDDIQEILSMPLLGIIPEDEKVLTSSYQGNLVTEMETSAGNAYSNICKRLLGEDIPFPEYKTKKRMFSRISHFFRKSHGE